MLVHGMSTIRSLSIFPEAKSVASRRFPSCGKKNLARLVSRTFGLIANKQPAPPTHKTHIDHSLSGYRLHPSTSFLTLSLWHPGPSVPSHLLPLMGTDTAIGVVWGLSLLTSFFHAHSSLNLLLLFLPPLSL